jgi:LuxR family maltose regulon positive regulatory protein
VELFFPKGQVIVQVINTKLSVPPLRAKLVERSGLIQKLNRDVERGFVLVSAPAGYGKSTLLSAWLTQVDFPCAWISLDAKDNDLGRFLTYLATALQMADPSTQQVLDASLHLNAPIDAEASLTPLINHLAQSSQPLCLVLDDYHVIQNQAVHQVVGFLLEHRPASLYLVVSTRADPPLPLARLRARSAVLEIRQSDLCFSTQESAEFLNHTMELQVSSEDIRHLTERTEGWIAGLQMAGLSLQGKKERTAIFSVSYLTRSSNTRLRRCKTFYYKPRCLSACVVHFVTSSRSEMIANCFWKRLRTATFS